MNSDSGVRLEGDEDEYDDEDDLDDLKYDDDLDNFKQAKHPNDEDDDEPEEGDLELDSSWPNQVNGIGQIGGLAVCKGNHVNVLHRADRIWDYE